MPNIYRDYNILKTPNVFGNISNFIWYFTMGHGPDSIPTPVYTLLYWYKQNQTDARFDQFYF